MSHCVRQSLVPVDAGTFALVVRYGVVAREEAHLERKIGDVCRGYRSQVRRWL
jgi:protein-S-isoprenylcysteine O-methyltransferase Ste14